MNNKTNKLMDCQPAKMQGNVLNEIRRPTVPLQLNVSISNFDSVCQSRLGNYIVLD